MISSNAYLLLAAVLFGIGAAGLLIRRNPLVMFMCIELMLNAANRDPEAYPDPNRLDLERDGVPHLTFGFGTHICLGFPLARTEGAVAFPALLQHYRHLEPLTERPEWLNSLVFRGMKALPVAVRRRTK